MVVLIDANSLINLYRYIFRVAVNKADIVDFLSDEVDAGRLIVLESVFQEASRHEGLLFTEMMPFIDENRHLLLDSSKTPPSSQVINDLNGPLLSRLGRIAKNRNQNQFEIEKNAFLNQGDIQLIMEGLQLHESGEEVFIVSEESRKRDQKNFKKIPLICDHYGLSYMKIEGYCAHHVKGVEWQDLI